MKGKGGCRRAHPSEAEIVASDLRIGRRYVGYDRWRHICLRQTFGMICLACGGEVARYTLSQNYMQSKYDKVAYAYGMALPLR